MICLKCNERIPILSNIDFKSGTISLYCQCDNENELYNIRDYLTKLNKIKEEKKDININIQNQICFIHKKNDIELFCIECMKELCYECDLKMHQKEKHQIIKLNDFYFMIDNNLNYLKNVKDLIFFENFNIEYRHDIINFIQLIYLSFISEEKKAKKNYTSLKNVCYIELCLSDNDSKKVSNVEDNKKEQKEKVQNKKTYKFGIKINSMRQYLNIQSLNFKDKNIALSFLNTILIPNTHYCALISAECKLLILSIQKNITTSKLEEKKEIEYNLDSKLYSSFYKLVSLTENIFALLYNSGSFDLFFIQKIQEKLKLIHKKYINQENSTNIINQIQLRKEENHIIVLIKEKIKFYKYDESDQIKLIKQIDRTNITLMLFLNFHNSVLTLFNTQEIIIKDQEMNNNFIIDIKEKQINIILELKSLNYLAITHFDSVIDIFDLNLMVIKNKLVGHNKIVNDIKELIPLENSNYITKLISCSDDKTIRIWDLVKFHCESIINLEKRSFLFVINILPEKEIMTLDNENVVHFID